MGYKDCAKSSLDFANDVNKLRLNLFGVNIIDYDLDNFVNACKIDDFSKKVIKRLIDDGIESVKHKNFENANKLHDMATINILHDGLYQIFTGLKK